MTKISSYPKPEPVYIFTSDSPISKLRVQIFGHLATAGGTLGNHLQPVMKFLRDVPENAYVVQAKKLNAYRMSRLKHLLKSEGTEVAYYCSEDRELWMCPADGLEAGSWGKYLGYLQTTEYRPPDEFELFFQRDNGLRVTYNVPSTKQVPGAQR